MIVSVARPARWPVDAGMFADITTKEITRLGWSTDTGGDSVFEVQFAVNLTQAEADAVVLRLTSTDGNDETMRRQAWEALADLRTIRDTGDTTVLTGLQLSRAARLFARVLVFLLRLYFRRTDAAD